MSDFPEYAIKAAVREFPCICHEGYTGRGMKDPGCRCEDFRNALDMLHEAISPPRCCDRCRNRWEEQVLADGARFSVILSRPMFVCDKCGSKRCERALDHRWACRD